MAIDTTSTASTATTTSGTNGVLQSLGIGSGLDISTMVTELTKAEMSGQTTNVTNQQASVTSQVSALGSLKSALSTFQSSLSAFGGTGSNSAFSALSATSGDDTVFTATTSAGAAAGSYQVQVQALAQSQQLISKTFSGGSTSVIGTGTLSFSLGTQGFNINVDSSDNTLADIRDAINSSASNPGINASLIYGSGGTAQLVLNSSVTGAANTIAVKSLGGDGGLNSLAYSSTNTANYTQQQAAQDSSISIAGVTHTSASNVVSDALDGITLNLVSAKPNTDISLTVANDTSHAASLMQSFVTAYNTLVQQLAPLSSYDSTTKAAGPMLGDSMLASLRNQMFHAMTNPVASAGSTYNTLASLGVMTNTDGTLSLNSGTLNKALNSNFQAVANALGGSDGVIARLNTMLSSTLSTTGIIQTRSANLGNRQTTINNAQAQITARSAVIQQRYMTQFNAMDTLLAQMQNTSTYLTQQFNALNKPAN